MRGPDNVLKKRWYILIGRAVGKHACYKPIAKSLGRSSEPLRHAVFISLEAVGHDGQIIPLEALSNCAEFIRIDACPAGSSKGSEGWDITGASTALSSIIASAKFPVKQIPIAPTPGPPHSSCARLASARSHIVTGLDPASALAKARNSALTHAF